MAKRLSPQLFVSRLSFYTTNQELKRLFSRFGVVTEARMILDPKTQRPKGFGFVSFESEVEAQKALKAMNGRSSDYEVIQENGGLLTIYLIRKYLSQFVGDSNRLSLQRTFEADLPNNLKLACLAELLFVTYYGKKAVFFVGNLCCILMLVNGRLIFVEVAKNEDPGNHASS